jgi:predicted Zn-dependent peptidase
MQPWRSVAVGAVLMILAAGVSQMAPPQGSAKGEVTSERWDSLGIEVQQLMLPNGFRVLLVEDHRMPRVAASLYYRIGALQEHYGEHGATHFLEHAIHQGTTTVGVKDREQDRALLRTIFQTEQELLAERNAQRNRLRERDVFFDEGEWPASEKETALRQKLYQLEDEQAKNRIFWEEYNWYRRHGGIMRHTDPVPANTGNEMMRIEVDLPRERLELFFRLEADRMVNAVLRGWEAQRFTVLEQFFILQRHDTGRFSEALNGVTGPAHPIFIHTGGHLRDHAYWNRASMLRMYDAYIVPNNATLTLVGDIGMADVQALAMAYFGKVPRAPEPPATMDVEVEPPPAGTVRLDWLEPLDSQLMVRYRIPAVGHRDRPAFDVIARLLRGADGILAASRTASQPAASWQVSASQNGSLNTLTLQASPPRDEDLPALERVAQQGIDRLRQGPIDEKALARIRSEFRFEWELQRSERGSLASQLGSFSTADDWRTMRTYLEARASTTPDQIRRVAERYLVPWNQVIATTRRNPPARAQKTTVSAPPAVTEPRGGAR